MGDMARPLQTVYCRVEEIAGAPVLVLLTLAQDGWPSQSRSTPVQALSRRASGYFVIDGQVKNFRRKKKSFFS